MTTAKNVKLRNNKQPSHDSVPYNYIAKRRQLTQMTHYQVPTLGKQFIYSRNVWRASNNTSKLISSSLFPAQIVTKPANNALDCIRWKCHRRSGSKPCMICTRFRLNFQSRANVFKVHLVCQMHFFHAFSSFQFLTCDRMISSRAKWNCCTFYCVVTIFLNQNAISTFIRDLLAIIWFFFSSLIENY